MGSTRSSLIYCTCFTLTVFKDMVLGFNYNTNISSDEEQSRETSYCIVSKYLYSAPQQPWANRIFTLIHMLALKGLQCEQLLATDVQLPNSETNRTKQMSVEYNAKHF